MKERTLSIEEARNVVADGPRWAAMRDFLWGFASQLDRGRVQAWLPSDLPPESLTPPYPAPLAKALLQHEGLEAIPFYDFPAENGSRLLLCSAATYAQIAQWLGVLIYADALRGIVAGDQVRALRQQLPGVYPEALTYTAYFSRWKFTFEKAKTLLSIDAPETWGERVRVAGFRVLASLLRTVPEPLMKRQRARFPVADEPCFEPLPEALFSEKQLDLLFLLLKLRFPEANALCS